MADKIQVWKAYDGNRAKGTIEEGTYPASSTKLQGLARYLIDNGNARLIEGVAPPVVAAPVIAHSLKSEEEVIGAPKTKRKAKS